MFRQWRYDNIEAALVSSATVILLPASGSLG